MDLILLQPGTEDVFGGTKNAQWAEGGNLIDGDGPSKWRQDILKFAERPCIQLVSVHQGMKQQMTTDVSNSARTSGRPVITEFTCVKYVDETSVKFFEYCLRAEPLDIDVAKPTKIYICRNSGDQTANILTISLRNAMLTEIQFQSHPDDMPTEQFKLNFTEIIWDYTVQLANGRSLAGVKSAGWSIARNRPINKGFTP
jgi:type VI secretion system secreted protein Hcp